MGNYIDSQIRYCQLIDHVDENDFFCRNYAMTTPLIP